MTTHCGKRARLVSAVGAADGRPLYACAVCRRTFTEGHYYEPGSPERLRALGSHHLQPHHRATQDRR